MIELLEKMYYEEDRLEKQLTKELKRYPKGSLELQRSGKGIRWYWKCPDKEERKKWGKRNKPLRSESCCGRYTSKNGGDSV